MPVGPDPSTSGQTIQEWLLPLSFALVFLIAGIGVVSQVPKTRLALLLITASAGLPGTVCAVAGGRPLYAWLRRQERAAFDGQVIARWEDTYSDSESDWQVAHIAVDDGYRGWNFEVSPQDFARMAPGDPVRVCYATQSGRLISLERLGGDAAGPYPGAMPG